MELADVPRVGCFYSVGLRNVNVRRVFGFSSQ